MEVDFSMGRPKKGEFYRLGYTQEGAFFASERRADNLLFRSAQQHSI
jgi:hypothetical protein